MSDPINMSNAEKQSDLKDFDSLMPILDEQSRDLRTMKRLRCYHCGKPMSEDDLDEIEAFLDTLEEDLVEDAIDRLRIAKRNPSADYFHVCKFGFKVYNACDHCIKKILKYHF